MLIVETIIVFIFALQRKTTKKRQVSTRSSSRGGASKDETENNEVWKIGYREMLYVDDV